MRKNEKPSVHASPEKLQWTFVDPSRLTETTARFDEEYGLAGDDFVLLLETTKRIMSHMRPATIANTAAVLRRCANALAMCRSRPGSPEDWSDALEQHLREDTAIAERTRSGIMNVAQRLFREVARDGNQRFARRNPFAPTPSRLRTEILHGEALLPVLRQARRDATAIMKSFRNPPEAHRDFIAEARELALGGPFRTTVGTNRNKKQALIARWIRHTGLRASDLTLHTHASPSHLIPFFILLAYALAGNPESIALMRRDAIEPFMHPSFGECIKLRLEKPRAGELYPYLLRDSGTLSSGSLIRTVLELTASLVPHAPPRMRNLAFLCLSTPGNILPLSGQVRGIALRKYLSARELPKITVKSLRSARGIDVYKATGNPFRVQRVLNHAGFAQTAHYINRAETEAEDALVIADVQRSIISTRSRRVADVRGGGEQVILLSHACANPFETSKERDHRGICISALWPFNDVHFVMLLEPRPVAFLLRDYGALCEAEKALPRPRFEGVYAAKKLLIEQNYLPMIDADLRMAAEAHIPSLPPAPMMEAL